MSHDTRKNAQHVSLVLSALKPILPRAVRDEYIAQLERLCMDGGDWPRHSIDMVLGAYKNQILLAFDGLTTALLLAGMAYCFSAAALPITLAILLGTALVPLILRGGFTHPFDINGKTYRPSSRWQYAMDSMTDSVVTMVMVLFCQSVTLMISPQLAMKPDPLFRGIALGMPVL